MSILPRISVDIIEILQYRHSILLEARVGKNPGRFKEKENRAGNTFFVNPNLVRGTLIKSFEFYNALEEPFKRAAFIMFLVSEIHPFDDGNGRMARIMMNAELVYSGESKILIPTVFRDDYLLTLRKLSRQGDSGPYIEMLEKAHKFSEGIYSEDFDEMKEHLISSNAFYEPDYGKRLLIKEIQT